MSDHPFAQNLTETCAFFQRSTACFRPEHGSYTPVPGMFTVAHHIAHAALTVDWFVAGAFSPQGFDLDFAGHDTAARKVTDLEEARQRFAAAFAAAIQRIGTTSLADLHLPIAAGPIMGSAPRLAIIEGIADHTAHHRGALTVYARLLGLVPAMPYA
jgi:uncharacterized damage-inducible protein DinB